MHNLVGMLVGSWRRELKRRDAAERVAWPIRLESLAVTEDRASILGAGRQSLDWLDTAAARWSSGGIAARYNLWTRRYQGPYPETTGYIIPTLLRAAEEFAAPSARARAVAAGSWLGARQRGDGAVRCNVDETRGDCAKPDKVVLFDCGAILQGFSALARDGDEACRDAVIRLGRFLVDSQNADGTWDRHLYFPAFGSHNTLVAYALIDAAHVTGEASLADAGCRCLTALQARILPSGFIEGCEFGGDPQLMFLHPYGYTLEGYVKSAMVLNDRQLLATAEGALEHMVSHMRRTGLIPSSYLARDLSPARQDVATTGLAQLADLLFKVGRLAERDDFLDPARRIMSFLRACVEPADGEAGARGGIAASFPIAGNYGAYTINNWTIKYFIDATLEELAAIDAGRL